MQNKYCENNNKYKRFTTRIVKIGDVPLGGNNPIRLQSMTTTDTMDVDATVSQSIRIINAGSDYVRITAPSMKSIKYLNEIKKKINKAGYKTPIIADIHFTPNAALEAAKIVEKVRINPGNYADVKKFKSFEYTDKEYSDELDRVYKRFSPLVDVCKEYGTAMRIGVNHGSLSDRILNRYGDTPYGMVESAMEFINICEDRKFHDIIISMKSSNPSVMVYAYRLLVNRMMNEKMNYPLHLGVTEAGEGEDGRIKSSVGIGSLLEDGLGDTIRVSLTEEPEFEIPVAKLLVDRYKFKSNHDLVNYDYSNIYDPFTFKRKVSLNVDTLGKDNVPRVVVDCGVNRINYEFLSEFGYNYIANDDKWHISDVAPDFIFLDNQKISIELPVQLKILRKFKFWNHSEKKSIPVLSVDEYLNNHLNILKVLSLNTSDIIDEELKSKFLEDDKLILLINSNHKHWSVDIRNFILYLKKNRINIPNIIYKKYSSNDPMEIQVDSSVDFGTLLVDGLIDGMFISLKKENSFNRYLNLSFKILQATRSRITQTEFISCPSCGRTQFDLMETTALVREKTSHLKGLKIAIMGCIVNGPGEMADADYGYVGTGIGLVSLYKKHNLVKNNIQKEDSLEELINLIKNNGDWVDPPNADKEI